MERRARDALSAGVLRALGNLEEHTTAVVEPEDRQADAEEVDDPSGAQECDDDDIMCQHFPKVFPDHVKELREAAVQGEQVVHPFVRGDLGLLILPPRSADLLLSPGMGLQNTHVEV